MTPHSTEVATKLVEADGLLQASIDLLFLLRADSVSAGMRKRLRQQIAKIDNSVRQIRDALSDSFADDLKPTN